MPFASGGAAWSWVPKRQVTRPPRSSSAKTPRLSGTSIAARSPVSAFVRSPTKVAPWARIERTGPNQRPMISV